MSGIVRQLNDLHAEDVIVLKDGTKIKVSDVDRVESLIRFSDVSHTLNNRFTFSEDIMSLEKWIDYLKLNYKRLISQPLNIKAALDKSNDKPIRKCSRWIYRELILKSPIKYTMVNFKNSAYYLHEPLYELNALISFVNNLRPIADLFKINNGNDIWWDDLDNNFKMQLLNIPVTITSVKQMDCDFKQYCEAVFAMFSISQVTQQCIMEI